MEAVLDEMMQLKLISMVKADLDTATVPISFNVARKQPTGLFPLFIKTQSPTLQIRIPAAKPLNLCQLNCAQPLK
jgi:hypothetical protein